MSYSVLIVEDEPVLARNMLVYGLGGLVAPFIGIKAIDLCVAPLLASLGI